MGHPVDFAVIFAGPLFCEDSIKLNHCKLFLLTMSFNQQNWDCYLEASQTYFGELNSTDPNRFPTGDVHIPLRSLYDCFWSIK